MEDDTEEGYVQGVTDEVNESIGAQEMYTTSTEVGPGPVRCRGGMAGASIRDSNGDWSLRFGQGTAPLQMAPNVGHDVGVLRRSVQMSPDEVPDNVLSVRNPLRMSNQPAAHEASLIEVGRGSKISALQTASERRGRETRQIIPTDETLNTHCSDIGAIAPNSKLPGSEMSRMPMEVIQTTLEMCNQTLQLMEQQVKRKSDSTGSKSISNGRLSSNATVAKLQPGKGNTAAAAGGGSPPLETSVEEMSSDDENARNRLRSVVVRKPSSLSVNQSHANHVAQSAGHGASQNSMCDASTSTDDDKSDAIGSRQCRGIERHHKGDTPRRVKRSLPTVAIVSPPKSNALRASSVSAGNTSSKQLNRHDGMSRSSRRHSSRESQYSLTESRQRSSVRHPTKKESDSSDDESSRDNRGRHDRGARRCNDNTSYQPHRRHEDSSPSPSPPRHGSSGRHRRRSSRRGNDDTSTERYKRYRKTHIKPDKYNGSTCVETFLVKFEAAAKHNDWSKREKAAHLMAALDGTAALLLWELHEPSYKQIVEKLRRRYGSQEQQEKFKVELRIRKRKSNESLQELAQDIERMASLAYPGVDQSTRETFATDFFIDALDNHSLAYKLREREPQTINSALTQAVKLEALYKSKEVMKGIQRPRLARGVAETKIGGPADQTKVGSAANEVAPKKNNTNRSSNLEKRTSTTDHTSRQTQAAEMRTQQLQRQVDELKAQIAQMTEQFARVSIPDVGGSWEGNRTPNQYHNMSPSSGFVQPSATGYHRRQPVTSTQNDRKKTTGPPYVCFGCGEPGHFRRDCPHLQSDERNYSHTAKPPDQVRGVLDGSYESEGKVYLRARIDGRIRYCLLDTGCELTVIPAKLVGKRKLYQANKSLIAANGTQIPISGWTTLQAYVGNSLLEINGLVTEHVQDIMLGIDWLQENRILWDFVRKEVIIEGQRHRLCTRQSRHVWCRRIMVGEDTVVPPMSQMDLSTKAVHDGLAIGEQSSSLTWATVPTECKDGLLVARSIMPNRVKELPVRVMNVTEEPVKLSRGTFITGLQPVTPVQTERQEMSTVQGHGGDDKKSQATDEEIIEIVMAKVHESVSQDTRERLTAMLHKYSSVFSKGDWDLGWTDIVTHNIDTGDHKPIRQPLRRYPPLHLQAIDRQLEDMLQQRVIEPASSPWASNIVLAKKKDGTLRCCIDFRQINEITRKDAYPLPRTDQCFDALAGSAWFSTFDLRSGFHQVCLAPEDADKTAFITRRGMFRFRTMPFGLCNAVATFQRLMDLVLRGLNLDICLVYLDDIILFSVTQEQHIERLEMILRRLKEANLKLKPSKCTLMQREVTFLGHVISHQGIATDPEKIKLIEEWPVPTNLKQLRGFLGLTGYYRRFVNGYSVITTPLNYLLKKDQPYQWTHECQEAFEQLKRALSTPPILALPNDEGTFVLDTDAAESSIGAVLSQIQDGHERVIAYAGRTLNKNEINYCVTRKELLAVVHFTRHFRQYLLGRQFVTRTDHAALSWLRKTPEPIGQNARWLEQLGEYDFLVKHRSGKSHGNADAISRHPCLRKPSCSACHPPAKVRCTTSEVPDQPTVSSDPLSRWSNEEIAAAQQTDKDIGAIIAFIKVDKKRPEWSEVERHSSELKALWQEWERLEIRGGVFKRRWTATDGSSDSWQIVLPRAYRQEFIKLSHTGMTGGHLGRSKTEDQVQHRAYWPGWRSDVATQLKCCTECAQYHRGKAPHQTPLQPFTAGEPFEIIAIDITGKHPKSAKGNEYILTMTDLFSKWAEAYPIRNHTAQVVAKVLIEQLFSRFGMVKRILTDQGTEFESDLFKELCSRMEIDKIRTSPYKPSTNGCVERFHRTLNAMLGKVVQENQRDWDERLPFVMAAYRAAKHQSTGYSPNFLVLGRENRAPVDLVLGEVQNEEAYYTSHDEFVAALQTKMREAYASAREHLNVAAERRKSEYDIKVKPARFAVGDWVWYYYPRRYVKRSPKWSKNYDGPFLVTRVIEPSDYVIQRNRRAKPQVVHGDKLKKCHGETPKSWLTPETQQEQVDGAANDQLPNNDQFGQTLDEPSSSGLHPSADQSPSR